MFEKEAEITFVREMSRKSDGFKMNEKLLQGIQHLNFTECKSAVIEKYLTYCKNMYIDEVMQWRLHYQSFYLDRNENLHLKLALTYARQCKSSCTEFTDLKGVYKSDLDLFGKRINEKFPLLNPALGLDEAIKQHQARFEPKP